VPRYLYLVGSLDRASPQRVVLFRFLDVCIVFTSRGDRGAGGGDVVGRLGCAGGAPSEEMKDRNINAQNKTTRSTAQRITIRR
jgi:hypothetical protein